MSVKDEKSERQESEKSPDEQLAAVISDRLVGDGLISEERRGNFESKLATGQIKAEDWRTYVAASLRNKSKSGNDE